jgi:hypothetical protein
LTEHGDRSYELRLTRFLQEQFADAAKEPTNRLRPDVAAQIGKARGYGLLSEQEVAIYVITAWLLGQSFDREFPAAHEVLTSPVSAELKAHFLEQWSRQMFEELAGGK